MDEILNTLAQQTGIDVSTARNALGAVVAFLKAHLPNGLSSQLMGALPDSNDLVDSFEANKTSGGILSAVTGLAGKIFGGGEGEASKLIDMLGKSGLDLSQIQTFLPKALELIKQYLPADLADKITGLIEGALSGTKPA